MIKVSVFPPSCPRAPANAKLVTEAIPRKRLAITALYPPPIALFERGGKSPRTRLRSVGRPWNKRIPSAGLGTQRRLGTPNLCVCVCVCVCVYFQVCGALWGVLQCLQRALCVYECDSAGSESDPCVISVFIPWSSKSSARSCPLLRITTQITSDTHWLCVSQCTGPESDPCLVLSPGMPNP
jgi:hypothetical protein